MKFIKSPFLLTIILIGELAWTPDLNIQAQNLDELAQKIGELAKTNSQLEMFSGTLLIAKNGQVVYSGAFGEANKDHHIPNTMETRFNIGSIGKTITAVAILQLVQDGKLKLSETLGKYYPDYPFPEKESITILHLLNHSSGLGDYMDHKDYQMKLASLNPLADILPLIFQQKPEFQAGERSQYSNSGFFLLGGIIEKVSGMNYQRFIQTRIFEPCKMTESGIFQEDEIMKNRSIGYTQNFDGSFKANVRTIPVAYSDGGLRTTVFDLLKFDQALRGETLLSRDIQQVMYTPSPQKETYACGWEVKDFSGQRYVGHSGGANGVEAFFYRFIDSGYTLIVLSNYHNGAEELTSNIMNLLFNRPYALPTVYDANFRLGYRLQGEGNLQEAANVLDRNIVTDTPHLMSLFFAANVRIRGGFDLENSIICLDRYLKLAGPDDFPPAGMAWQQKGTAYRKLGLTQEAIKSFKRALELDPNDQYSKESISKLAEGK